MSTFRVYNSAGNTVVLNSSEKLDFTDPLNIMPNKPENQIAFFYQYHKSNTSVTFVYRDLKLFRKNRQLFGDRENAYA